MPDLRAHRIIKEITSPCPRDECSVRVRTTQLKDHLDECVKAMNLQEIEIKVYHARYRAEEIPSKFPNKDIIDFFFVYIMILTGIMLLS